MFHLDLTGILKYLIWLNIVTQLLETPFSGYTGSQYTLRSTECEFLAALSKRCKTRFKRLFIMFFC